MFREAQEPVKKRLNGLVKLGHRLIQIVHYCYLTDVTFFTVNKKQTMKDCLSFTA